MGEGFLRRGRAGNGLRFRMRETLFAGIFPVEAALGLFVAETLVPVAELFITELFLTEFLLGLLIKIALAAYGLCLRMRIRGFVFRHL